MEAKEEYDEFIHTLRRLYIFFGLTGLINGETVTKRRKERKKSDRTGRRANSIFDFVPNKLNKVDGYNSGGESTRTCTETRKCNKRK